MNLERPMVERCLVGAAVGCLLWARAVVAADAAGDAGLQEIVVTATRQAQPLSKVPASILAMSQDELDKQGVRSVDDVSRLAPGVDFSRTGMGLQSTISIRGISSSVGSSTTGIYIDDTPVQTRTLLFSSTNPYPIIFDLDRVEVLRGPQGTLFGAQSEGGNIRFITPQPDLKKYSGYSRAEYAVTRNGDPSYEAGAAFGGPIIDDTLAFRVSAYHRRDGGFMDRERYLSPGVGQENANYLDSTAMRAALTWQPVNGIQVTPSVFAQQQFQNDGGTAWANLSDARSARYVNGSVGSTPSHDRFTLPSLAVKVSLSSFATLFSNTSYLDRQSHSSFDYSLFDTSYFGPDNGDPAVTFALPGYHAYSPQTNAQQNFTQEIRLQSNDPDARISWVVGAFYSNNTQRAHEEVRDPFFNYYFGVPAEEVFGAPLINGETAYIDDFKDTDRETAIFANVTASVTDRLKVSVGARASRAHFDFTEYKDGPAAGGFSTSGGKENESPVTPKAVVSFQVNPENLMYASASKGYRVGGANPPIPVYAGCTAALESLGLQEAPLTYKSDSTWSYEVGSKNRLLDGRLQLAESAYFVKWNHIIQSIPNLANCPFSFTTNLGDATSKGADFQADFRVTHNWLVGAAVAYNKAEYGQTIRAGGATQDLITKGHTLGSVPWTITATSEYDFPGLIGEEAYARAVFDYHSSITGKTSVNDPSYNTYDPSIPDPPATSQLDLRFGTRFGGGWDLSVFGNNVLNSHAQLDYARDAITAPVFHFYPTRPLTVGVTLIKSF